MKEITVDALIENLQQVMTFIDEELEVQECPMKIMMQIDIAVEEIFVNIAHYAYGEDKGKATISLEIKEDPKRVCISFQDQGQPYNPLEKEDPDINLSAEEREIGGLGIFMVKKSMDQVHYEYKDGSNVFTIEKHLEA